MARLAAAAAAAVLLVLGVLVGEVRAAVIDAARWQGLLAPASTGATEAAFLQQASSSSSLSSRRSSSFAAAPPPPPPDLKPRHRLHNVVTETGGAGGGAVMTQLDETFTGERAGGYAVRMHYTVDPAESVFPKLPGISEALLRDRVLRNGGGGGGGGDNNSSALATKMDLLLYASKAVGVDALAAVKSDIMARLRNRTRTCFCRVDRAPPPAAELAQLVPRRTQPRFFSQIINNPRAGDDIATFLRRRRAATGTSPSDTGAIDQPGTVPLQPPAAAGGAGAKESSVALSPFAGVNATCSCFVNASSLGAAEAPPPPPAFDRDAARRYRYPCAATTACHLPVDDRQLLLALDSGDRDSISTAGGKRWWRLAENKLFQTLLRQQQLKPRRPTPAAGDGDDAAPPSHRPTTWHAVTGTPRGDRLPQTLEGTLHNRVELRRSDPQQQQDAGDAGGGGAGGGGVVLGGGALHFSFRDGLPPLRAPTGVSVAGLDISPAAHPDLTIELWVNLDANTPRAGGPDLAKPNGGFAVGCGDYTPRSGRRAVLLHDAHFSATGTPRVAVDAGAPYLSSVAPLSPHNWHHVVAVWQQGGFSYLYVNGVQLATAATFTNNAPCHEPLWIGHTAFVERDGEDSNATTGAGPGVGVAGANRTNATTAAAAAAATQNLERMPADFGSGIEGLIGLVRVFGRAVGAAEVHTLYQRGELRFPDD